MWVYIIPGLISVWNVLFLRNFIMAIPESINDSAEMDGVSQLCILFGLIIPLSIPSMVTISLFYALDHWNAWFDALIFIEDPKKFPLQMSLRNILMTATMSFDRVQKGAMAEFFEKVKPPSRALKNTSVIIVTLPIICVYPS